MGAVGRKYSPFEYFLPDILLSAKAMKADLKILRPCIEKNGMPTIGTVVIGTVEGDLHDIGKNVVATFLKGSGFNVRDLGLKVPDQEFIDEVKDKRQISWDFRLCSPPPCQLWASYG